MNPVPILFLGDSPSLRGGLSRIGRDLALHVASLPQFRVGYLGRGGVSSRHLPFIQYNFPESEQWGENLIEHVWSDFAADVNGIIFTAWDASRLDWFAEPQNGGLPESLYKFLKSNYFQRWGYFPVDGNGISGKLTKVGMNTVNAFNRKLAYSKFGQAVLNAEDWVPHGINTNKFQPRTREGGRLALKIGRNDLLVGCVMTNQPRKDWGLAFAAMREFRQNFRGTKFWAHVDVLSRSHAWDIRSLIEDYGAEEWTRVTFTGDYNDVELSHFYSACDLTILPSLGEGFGYPIAESLSCGVPIVHGNYAAGPEIIQDKSWLVEPCTWRLVGLGNTLRPVYNPEDFVQTMINVIEQKVSTEYCRGTVEHLEWKKLWPSTWKKWFLGGLNG